MPGPVSDSYDPEWGTRAKAVEIAAALDALYHTVGDILDDAPPVYIGDLVGREDELGRPVDTMILSEWEWRIIRFALERAISTI